MKKKDIQFPECWEEVKPVEWLHLLKIRSKLAYVAVGITLRDIKREWCRFVLANRGYRIGKKNVDDLVLIDKLTETLDWMWKVSDDGKEVELIYDSTVNLIPSWGKYRGPLSHGADITFAEFRHAVTLMNIYLQDKDIVTLRALCGTLYRLPGKDPRSKNFDGKYREDFHPSRTALYAERMKLMPEWIMWGIYCWFAYFCQYLIEGDFILDGKQVSFASVFERNTASGDRQDIGMNSILFSVAESGIFGNVQDADNELLLKIMLKLLDDKQRADSLLKKT